MIYQRLFDIAKEIDENKTEAFILFCKTFEKLKNQDQDLYQRFSPQLRQLKEDFSLEKFFPILVFLENKLKTSVADEDFLKIQAIDGKAVQKHAGVAILDNIRSAFNVGSVLRSAEAFGFSKVYLCGYTPSLDNPKLQKSSMGVEKWIDIESELSVLTCIETLKDDGYNILGVETYSEAKPIASFEFAEKSAFIFGNERFGLSKDAMAAVDSWLTIPLLGNKKSLNVGVCAGICFSELAKRYGKF